MFELPSNELTRLAAATPALFLGLLFLVGALVLWRAVADRRESPFAHFDFTSMFLCIGVLVAALAAFFFGGLPQPLYEAAAESQKPTIEEALETRYHLHSMEFALVESDSEGFSYVVQATKANDETVSFTVESQGAVAVVRPLGTD